MSEDLAVEALLEFLNACEAGIIAARQRIKAVKVDSNTTRYDMSRIRWTPAQGSKGPYECNRDVENPEFQALLKDLEAHDGKFQRDGYFIWKFSNNEIIGRKKTRRTK